MPAAKDHSGKRYNMLVGVRDVGSDKHGKRLWLFQCDCGNELISIASDVSRGKTVSCSCYMKSVVSARNARAGSKKIAIAKTRHGASGPNGLPEYHIWKAMRQRCNNPNDKHYSDYGGRGIRVCPEWDDFTKFLDCVGRRPDASYSLDRINNDLGYQPGNVRWATHFEQAANRRTRRTKWQLQLTA